MIDKGKIKEFVLQQINGTDQFLVDIKLSFGKLSVFVDKPAGITLEECGLISRSLFNYLDEQGFTEKHEIEVSSPGMDSPLMVPQQYLRRVGRELRVFDKTGVEIKGILKSADSAGFEILEKKTVKENKTKTETEHVHKFHYDDIRETKLIVNFKTK